MQQEFGNLVNVANISPQKAQQPKANPFGMGTSTQQKDSFGGLMQGQW